MTNGDLETIKKQIKGLGQNQVTEVKNLAEKAGMKIEDVLNEIAKIYNDPVLKDLKDDTSRTLTAIRIFKARVLKRLLSTAIPYKIWVVDKTGITKFTERNTGKERQVARIFGIAIPNVPDVPAKFTVASITLFDQAAEWVNKLSRKRMYMAKLTGGIKSGVLVLYSDDTTDFTELPAESVGDVDAIIKQVYPQKTIAELKDLPAGASVYLRVSVVNIKTGTNAGRNWGLYVVVDDSISLEEFKNTGGLTVFLDADQVRYASGSEIGIVGEVRKSEDGSYNFRGLFVNPILVFEMQPSTASPQQVTTAPEESKGIEDLLDDSEPF